MKVLFGHTFFTSPSVFFRFYRFLSFFLFFFFVASVRLTSFPVFLDALENMEAPPSGPSFDCTSIHYGLRVALCFGKTLLQCLDIFVSQYCISVINGLIS